MVRLTIFGPGRVGRSLARYAESLGAEVMLFGRADEAAARTAVEAADVIAAAIPDDRLAAWLKQWRAAIGERPTIHFSGARLIPGMRGYHPLYSFPREPIEPWTMARVAIAREEGAPAFAALFPGATNPEFELKAADRAYYHALAVLSGNFAAHLWNEAAKALADRFGLDPAAIMGGYLEGVVERFRENPVDSMTGPVARKDAETVAANLAAIKDDPRLRALYEAFISSAWPNRPGDR